MRQHRYMCGSSHFFCHILLPPKNESGQNCLNKHGKNIWDARLDMSWEAVWRPNWLQKLNVKCGPSSHKVTKKAYIADLSCILPKNYPFHCQVGDSTVMVKYILEVKLIFHKKWLSLWNGWASYGHFFGGLMDSYGQICSLHTAKMTPKWPQK